MLYIDAYIWNLERQYWQSYIQGNKGDTDVKNSLLDSVEEGKSGIIWKNSTETCTLRYVKQKTSASSSMKQGTQGQCSGHPRGIGWWGRWEGFQDGAYTCTPVANPCWYKAKTIRILLSNYSPIKIINFKNVIESVEKWESSYSVESEWSCSVVYNSLQLHGLWSFIGHSPWNFPGKSTGVGCHFLLQGIFLTQGLNPDLPHCRQTLYHLSHQEGECKLVQPFSSVLSHVRLCNTMDCSMPGLLVHHQWELTQTHVHSPMGAYLNSCPLSQWCNPAISLIVIPFSSCLQSFPASGSFQMGQLFTSGDQSIGVSASTSVLPMNIQDWFPLWWTSWISLQSKGLSRVFSNTTVQKHQFCSAQLSLWSNSHIHTWPLEKP